MGSSSIIKTVFPVLFSRDTTFWIKEPVCWFKFLTVSEAPIKSAKNVAVKVVPFPKSLLTTTSPPIKIASCFDIVRPNPVPPYFLVVELSAWTNELNSLAICSSDIPMPVSLTSIAIRSPPSWVILLTPTVIFPFSVNLQALEIKFNTTCFTLVWSAVTKSISVLNSITNSLSFFCASGDEVFKTSSNIWLNSNVSLNNSTLPASIFDKSNTSFIRVKRCFPALKTLSKGSSKSSKPSSAASSFNISVNPIIAFNGVLNSWLIFAKNWLLVWFAALAFSLATSNSVIVLLSSSSRFFNSVISEKIVKIPPSSRRLSVACQYEPS